MFITNTSNKVHKISSDNRDCISSPEYDTGRLYPLAHIIKSLQLNCGEVMATAVQYLLFFYMWTCIPNFYKEIPNLSVHVHSSECFDTKLRCFQYYFVLVSLLHKGGVIFLNFKQNG